MSTKKTPHQLPQSGGSYTVDTKGKLNKQAPAAPAPVKPAVAPEKER
ncbi:hypothetical protein [Antarcticimicrobium sediminis]|nr:hypothetical protein [Antarcticimicrobium sediminis]